MVLTDSNFPVEYQFLSLSLMHEVGPEIGPEIGKRSACSRTAFGEHENPEPCSKFKLTARKFAWIPNLGVSTSLQPSKPGKTIYTTLLEIERNPMRPAGNSL